MRYTSIWSWWRIVGLMVGLAVVWLKADYGSLMMGQGDFWDARNYLRTIRDMQQGTSPYQVAYMQTLGPPTVILPYLPLVLLPEPLALSVFSVSSLVAGGAMCWLLTQYICRWLQVSELIFSSRWLPRAVRKWLLPGVKGVAVRMPISNQLEIWLLLLLMLLSAFPVRLAYITGQWGVVLGLLITGLLILPSSLPLSSGLVLSALTITKTFFGFGWLALIRYRPRVLGWAMVTTIALITLSASVLKFEYFGQYQHRFQGVMWQPDRIVDVAYYNQSLKTTLSRLKLVDESVFLWVIVAVVAALYCCWSGNVAAAMVLSILLSPVAWQHYFVALFPLFIWVVPQLTKWWLWVIWIISLSWWWIEFPGLHGQTVTLWTGMVSSHYAWSALLLTGILVYNHHRL